MLTETGRVVAVEYDGLWVETLRKSTCGSCAARSGCGHGLMNQLGDGRSAYVRVLPGDCNLQDCQVDDQVRIGIPEDLMLRGSFIIYVVPLLGLLLGAASVGSIFASAGDGAVVTGALAGLAIGVSLVRMHSLRHRDDEALQPTLLEILH